MRTIYKGRDYALPYQIKTNSGGDVDLTGYKITAVVKEDRSSSTVKVSKENTAAGGSDSELKILNASNGIVVVYYDRSDTLNLTATTNYLEIYATDNTNDYSFLETWDVRENVNSTGDSIEDDTITQLYDKIYEHYYEFTLTTPSTFVEKVSRSLGTVTPSVSGDLVTLTSTATNFDDEFGIEVGGYLVRSAKRRTASIYDIWLNPNWENDYSSLRIAIGKRNS